MRRRRMLAWCAGGLATPLQAHHARTQHADRSQQGWQLGNFALTDHYGRPFTEQQLRGRWSFVLLGDTRCGETCATALAALRGLCQRIERADAVNTTQIVFLSADARHDTPKRLRDHLAPYGTRFIGVSGPPPVLRRLIDDLGLADDEPAGGWPGAQHRYRGSIVLVGPDAVVRTEYLPPFDALLLTSDYMRVRSRR